MAEHTPTPWAISGREGRPNCYIAAIEVDDEPIDGAVHEFDHLIATLEPDSELGGYGTMEGNAELIKRACNSHEGLVRAIKEAMAVIENHSDFTDKDGTPLERTWDSLGAALSVAETEEVTE